MISFSDLRICAALVIVAAGLANCSTHEPGPAERLGKSLDEIADTIGDIDKDDRDEDEEEFERRRERQRELDRQRDDYYRSDRDDDRYEPRNDRSAGGFNRPYSEPERYDPLRRDDNSDQRLKPREDADSYPDSRY